MTNQHIGGTKRHTLGTNPATVGKNRIAFRSPAGTGGQAHGRTQPLSPPPVPLPVASLTTSSRHQHQHACRPQFSTNAATSIDTNAEPVLSPVYPHLLFSSPLPYRFSCGGVRAAARLATALGTYTVVETRRSPGEVQKGHLEPAGIWGQTQLKDGVAAGLLCQQKPPHTAPKAPPTDRDCGHQKTPGRALLRCPVESQFIKKQGSSGQWSRR